MCWKIVLVCLLISTPAFAADVTNPGVTGPASATSGHIATYNGTTGKIIQDGGVVPTSSPCSAFGTTAGTCAQGNDSRITGAVQSGGPLGTPSSGTATNLAGTAAGLTAGAASTVVSGGTGTTASAGDDSTKVATTAYAENVGVPTFKAIRTTSQTLSSSADWETVVFNSIATPSFNDGSAYSTTTGLFTAPTAGYYEFCGSVYITGTITPGVNIAAALSKNGVVGTGTMLAGWGPYSTSGTTIGGCTDVILAAADTMEFDVNVTTSAGVGTVAGSSTPYVYFSGHRLHS